MRIKKTLPIFCVHRKDGYPSAISFFSTREKARDFLRAKEYPMHEKIINLKDSIYCIELIQAKDIDEMSKYIYYLLKELRGLNGN